MIAMTADNADGYVELREAGCESWLDPRWSRVLAWRLYERLAKRCQGKRGLFLTLTYRRDEYANSLDLYRRSSEEQHVALFLRKVARYLRQKLTGLWFCKMEFQGGGWVHWHIIVLGVKFIPANDLADMWGHGFVKIRRLNKKNIRYCTKYTSKPGQVPAWLYLERSRSVKVVRVSPGFWGDTTAKPRIRCADYEKWGPIPFRVPCVFRPLGERMERSTDKWVGRDHTGRFFRGAGGLVNVLASLVRRNTTVLFGTGAWVRFRCTREDVDRAAAPPARAGRGLDLTDTGNPDGFHVSGYIDEWLRELAAAESGGLWECDRWAKAA